MTRKSLSAALMAAFVLITALCLWAVLRYERIVSEGRQVLVALAPVDPRSIMQGDYMALRFAIDNELPRRSFFMSGKKGGNGEEKVPLYAYVSLDEQNRASFAGTGEDALAGNRSTIAMKIRNRNGDLSIGPNAFFFEEGSARIYEAAQWGEFHVAGDGTALLTHLRDANLKRLGPIKR